MPSIAFLFPGQGRLPESLPTTIDELAPLLQLTRAANLELEAWIAAGDSERLTKTDAAQPALFLDSLSRDRALRAAGWRPACVAGHSLGEYAALVSAAVLRPECAMQAVIERGRLMQGVDGAMSAILKLDFEVVAGLCRETHAVIANHNAPTQIVISGPHDAVQSVGDQAEARGGRVIPLAVSGPFHSPLMKPAQDALATILEEIDFHSPKTGIISAVAGTLVESADDLKSLMLKQITATVRWVDVLAGLEKLGIEQAIEVGSGDVLTRLGRRSDSSIQFMTFEEACHA